MIVTDTSTLRFRWGSVYLAEMKRLPSEVEAEFLAGNFVVKWSNRNFSEVDPDHALEWLNCVGKESGGIVGITKTPSALSRWALSYNLRSIISANTLELLGMSSAAEYRHHSEESAARKMKDKITENRLKETLKKYDAASAQNKDLVKITSKEKCPPEVQDSLLSAKVKGEQLLQDFVQTRLGAAENCTDHPFFSPLKKQRCMTFASMTKTHIKVKKKDSVEVDSRLLQKIMGLYHSGRPIDIMEILKHELTAVPTSIALADGTLRTGQKSQLLTCLTAGVECPNFIPVMEPTGVVIDAMGLVHALGKPAGAKTFGDIASAFSTSVRAIGERHGSQRLDLVFDRYDRNDSIKSAARDRRQMSHIEGHNNGVHAGRNYSSPTDATVLPSADWRCYLGVSSNKASLASFLGSAVLRESYDFTVVVSGAFENTENVRSNRPEMDLSSLRADHEEADTRIMVHVSNMPQRTIVVYSRDTDVLVLLTHHRERLPARQLWMRTGPNKDPKYIPIHDVVKTHSESVLKELLAFHALTGCDTTSFFFRKGKKGAWKNFTKHSALLHGLGKSFEEPSQEVEHNVGAFVSRWYGLPEDVNTVDRARAVLFQQGKHVASLPPTTDALKPHLRRCHYQAAVWEQALKLQPALPPRDGGWCTIDGFLKPVLSSLPPVPSCLINLIRCTCKKVCAKRCSCTRAGIPCAAGCKCVCNRRGESC